MMRKKILDLICGALFIVSALVGMGAIGAYEMDSISGPECIIRFAVCFAACVCLGCLNGVLMDEVERRAH